MPTLGFAQKKKTLKTIFYNLSIDLPGKELIEQINNNSLFADLKVETTPGSNFGFNYSGKIDIKDFPSTLPRPEMAILKLTGNLGYMVETKKDYQSSDIIVEYLFANEESGESYFSQTWDKIKTLSKDTSDAQFGFKDEEDFSYGKSIKLTKRKMLPELYLLKREYGEKVYVSIIYRREGY